MSKPTERMREISEQIVKLYDEKSAYERGWNAAMDRLRKEQDQLNREWMAEVMDNWKK